MTESRTFDHGVHPADQKSRTRDLPVQRMPFVDEYVLPLRQHLGAPSKPLVAAGQTVYRGQPIAEANGFVSVALHAPVTGRVRGIERRPTAGGEEAESIVIERDTGSPQTLYNERPVDAASLPPADVLKRIQAAGIVGLGGAAFPTHVKLSVPQGKKVEFLLVNGCECEPYLTCDHRVMLERTAAIFAGLRVCLAATGAERAYFGVETNKLDVLERLQAPPGLPVEFVPLETKYPQGAEKMLITSVTGREVPSGKLPIDVQVVVQNVGTLAAIGEYFRYGQPLIERVLTVTGPGIREARNLLVPIGTPVREVLEWCGGLTDDAKQIILGGPMMGQPTASLDVPVVKGTSGILALTEREFVKRDEMACLRCLRCADACPLDLNPCRLGQLAKAKRYDDLLEHHLLDCMECACCSYVCPSGIPLVQRFRVAKALIREKQARDKAAKK